MSDKRQTDPKCNEPAVDVFVRDHNTPEYHLASVVSKHTMLARTESGSYLGMCPFGHDRGHGASFIVQGAKFQCFGGGEGGDLAEFSRLMGEYEWTTRCMTCGLTLVCFGLEDCERRTIAHTSEVHPEQAQMVMDSIARGPIP